MGWETSRRVLAVPKGGGNLPLCTSTFALRLSPKVFHPLEPWSGMKSPHVPLGMNSMFSIVLWRGVWEGDKRERQEGEPQEQQPQGEGEEWGGNAGGERNDFTLCHS